MKNCKSCNKEIDEIAIKCPFCQSFQSWFRDSKIYGFIFPIMFIPIMFYSMGIWGGKEYSDYKDKFTVTQFSSAIVGEKKEVTYQIINNTSYNWNNLSYRVLYKGKDGNIISVDTDSEYRWTIKKGESGLISVSLKDVKDYSETTLEIVDLKTTRF